MINDSEVRRLLTAADPARTLTVDSAAVQELLAIPSVEDLPRLDDPRRRRSRHRTGIIAGALVLSAIGGTAAAVQLLHDPAPEVAGVECVVDPSNSSILGSGAGDPLQRCRQFYEENGLPVPDDLVAYRLPGRIPIVGPRSDMPQDATLLSEGSRSDARLAELNHAVNDAVTGVSFSNRPCQNETTTRTQVAAILKRLELTGYTIEDDPEQPASKGRCVTAHVDSTRPAIILEHRDPTTFPSDSPTTEGPPELQRMLKFQEVVGRRAQDMHTRGATAEQLGKMVTTSAAELGIPDNAYRVDTTDSPVAAPARMYLEIGGILFFHIYE